MADAESNLVPSEAADQVEVALEEQAAADDGILYLNEYQYENDLVTDFARLVASPRRRGSLYVAAAIAALIGIGMLVAGGNWIKFGVVLIVFGAFWPGGAKTCTTPSPATLSTPSRPTSPWVAAIAASPPTRTADGLGQERQVAVLPV